MHSSRKQPMRNALSDVRLLTVAEVAEVLRVSTMTVYRMVHSGELPALRFGRSYRVPETVVLAMLGDAGAQNGADAADGSGMGARSA